MSYSLGEEEWHTCSIHYLSSLRMVGLQATTYLRRVTPLPRKLRSCFLYRFRDAGVTNGQHTKTMLVASCDATCQGVENVRANVSHVPRSSPVL